MTLFTQLLRAFLISMLAMLAVILIVLFPRQVEVVMTETQVLTDYQFSFQAYGQQIASFFSELFWHGSLGSNRYQFPVIDDVLNVMGNSLLVIITALVSSFFFGVLKGIIDYKLDKTRWRFFGSFGTWLMQSFPDFLLILLLQWVFIHYFPNIRIFSAEPWYSFLIPALFVMIYPMLYISRITQVSISNQEGMLYLVVAKSKGLPKWMLFYKHVFSNCWGTILTHLPSLMLYILSNLLIVEYFLNYPGAANRLFIAIDYSVHFGTGGNYEATTIIGIAFCFCLLVLLVQWISIIARSRYEVK
ncbi:ABC transporter permease subunit [Paenibacillus sp. 1001270B_150601_E10]|uniref:ABC transporter permease subunit n=1 Tax=Paenibacillus sp. 1001270B_150601_E10 TaxID=2787079 RepID=UPI00189CDCF3|nr:ABC transporter permease subunit [Paenibacillus sp. 1001270B_150601_E10]